MTRAFTTFQYSAWTRRASADPTSRQALVFSRFFVFPPPPFSSLVFAGSKIASSRLRPAAPAHLSFAGLPVAESHGTYHHLPGKSGSSSARSPMFAAAFRSACNARLPSQRGQGRWPSARQDCGGAATKRSPPLRGMHTVFGSGWLADLSLTPAGQAHSAEGYRIQGAGLGS